MLYRYENAHLFNNLPQPDYSAESGNIILYGAGVNGAIALQILLKKGIKICAFADSDERKHGTTFCQHPVISLSEMKNNYADAIIIVTPYIKGKLFESLREEGFIKIYDVAPLFVEFETDDIVYFPWKIDIIHAVTTFLEKRAGIGHRALTIMITEKCTLRCKECMAFIPYFNSPMEYDFQKLSQAIRCVLPTGLFSEVYLEGGEALLHKNLPEIIELILNFKEIKRIRIITNGTIIPNKQVIRILKNPKIVIWISDYGDLSAKKEELKKIASENGITCYSTTQHWYAVTRAKKYARSDSMTLEIFNNCCKGLDGLNPFLINGRIYRCQFHAQNEQLGIIPANIEDSISVFDNTENLKDRLVKFFLQGTFIDACRYCMGRGYLSEEVPVAEQLSGEFLPLEKIY